MGYASKSRSQETIKEMVERMEWELMTPEEAGDKIVNDFLDKIDKILTSL